MAPGHPGETERGEAVHIYQLSGRNVDVTDAMRDYVEEKLTRLDRFSDQITDARVVLTVRDVRDAGRRNRVEVQLNVPNGIIRAEEHHADMYAAIDRASDVLERQLRKFKTKYLRHRQEAAPPPQPGLAEADVNAGLDDTEFRPEIVRTKRFDLRPMSPEDAVTQMEALGHDFYVFKNMDTGGCAVVYRRRDGHYGLIEPS
nr:ribosome-associated translation inhibitor RaiA [Deinococcus sp. DB0503]